MFGPRTVVKQLMWPSGKNVWRPCNTVAGNKSLLGNFCLGQQQKPKQKLLQKDLLEEAIFQFFMKFTEHVVVSKICRTKLEVSATLKQ